MKKLTLLSIGVAIALVGFIAILYFLPCKGECCGKRDQCEMRDGDGKCSGHEEACKDGDMKCSGHDEACGKENREEKEWTDADGKVHKEIRVTMGDGNEMGGCKMQMGNSCGMQMGNHGCCCCCMMMNGCHMDDSAKMDSAHVKVRGKL